MTRFFLVLILVIALCGIAVGFAPKPDAAQPQAGAKPSAKIDFEKPLAWKMHEQQMNAAKARLNYDKNR